MRRIIIALLLQLFASAALFILVYNVLDQANKILHIVENQAFIPCAALWLSWLWMSFVYSVARLNFDE